MKAELLFDAKATLGEGPAWDEKTEALYWTDILENKIYRWEDCLARLDFHVGCLAPSSDGTLMLGLQRELASFDLDSRAARTVRTLASEPASNRINDGKCDPRGRFLFGTMDINEKEACGALYSFDGKNVARLRGGIRISNGLAWSPDYKTLYYIDTPTRRVQAFDYDLQSGQIANPRDAFEVPAALGYPDGMTSDAQGNLWIAMWGGAQITRWNPRDGALLEQISVPALQTSSCVFGGKRLNELYVTSARIGMSASDLKKYPLSGGLFKIETKVEGTRTFPFQA